MKRPEIIAHRGASREQPENTLAAFRRALELGGDAVELDVHLTQDGVLVVHHDAVPAAAPNSALAGRAIGTLTAEELAGFRVRGEPVPILRDVVEALGLELTVYCELKGPGTAGPAARFLAGAAGQHAVHSFDHRMVAEAGAMAPAVARGILEVSYHIDPVAALISADARDLWQQWELIDDNLVNAVHAEGKRMVAWTVNDAAVMARLAGLGVDGLCTDDVALARSIWPGGRDHR